ncbi:MAG: hypothetical protein CME32_24345 [Gimesia sp.]|nr:hypothetical protein [Gimesia sp.]
MGQKFFLPAHCGQWVVIKLFNIIKLLAQKPLRNSFLRGFIIVIKGFVVLVPEQPENIRDSINNELLTAFMEVDATETVHRTKWHYLKRFCGVN